VRDPHSDAYGNEIWDHYRKHEGTEVIERDDGYIDPSQEAPGGYFSTFRDWQEVER